MIGNEIKMTSGTGLVLHHKGVYNLKQLYNKAKDWIDSKNYDFTEKEYSTKVQSARDEVKINWVAERSIDDYAQFYIETLFVSKDNNKKPSACKGEIRVNIIAKIVLDYRGEWKKSKFLSVMLPIYNTFIIKKQVNQYKAKMWNELMDYISVIKKELNIYD